MAVCCEGALSLHALPRNPSQGEWSDNGFMPDHPSAGPSNVISRALLAVGGVLVRVVLGLGALIFIASTVVAGLIAAVVVVPYLMLSGRSPGRIRMWRYGHWRRQGPGAPEDGHGDVVDVEVREIRDR
jgi:hypothetical protein